ncbi:cytochrome c subunit of flavocytochrome c sulfide dehydrogenase [Salinisphaera sp. C84B14]|uniref:c-type cytochrome n=1 Tax=Salinisphaera sp. C84B14 TaxID=1304155 RepID=UPI0033424AE0
MRYRARVIAALLTVFAAAVAAAGEGEMLASACSACHGPEGRSVAGLPSLAGMNRHVFMDRMQAFRHGDGTIMNRIAPAYDAAQTAALADYFAALDRGDNEQRHAP